MTEDELNKIVMRLQAVYNDDHRRGCEGRNFACTCGFDVANESTAQEAIKGIAQLRAEITLLKQDNSALNFSRFWWHKVAQKRIVGTSIG